MTRKQILRDFLEAVWNQGEVEACDLFLADRYTITHDPGDPWDGQTLDREGFKQRVTISRAPCPDQVFDIQSLTEEDDRVVVAWLWRATHQGDIAGFPPTGRILTMSGITVYAFEGDRICGHWQAVDRLGLFRRLAAA
jgi:steroid delta-isomerase-like uncharacterized protein